MMLWILDKLVEALNQIVDLQNEVEDQKNAFEAEIFELKNHIEEKDLEVEALKLEHNAKIKALEEEIQTLKKLNVTQNAQDCEAVAAVPVPLPSFLGGAPSPPPFSVSLILPGIPPPPPPPLPPMNSCTLPIQAVMGSTRKGNRNNSKTDTSSNGKSTGKQKPIPLGSPPIDDIVSQLKQGIKLRPTARPLSQNLTDKEEDRRSQGYKAVEEMRSVIVKLRRTKEAEKRNGV